MLRGRHENKAFFRRLKGLALPLLLIVMAPSPSSAQILRGNLLELGTDQPISRGLVALLNQEGERVAAVLTNELGEFTLRAPMAGSFRIYAEGLGYRPATDGPLELGQGSEVDVQFHLERDPLPIDSLAVMGTPRNRWLESSGFYERKELGRGHFIEREFIEERNPRQPTDLFRQIPGFRVMRLGDGSGRNVILSRRFSTFKIGSKAGQCGPMVYLDGLQMGRAHEFTGGSLDHLLEPSDIVGIEAYVGVSQIPEKWRGSDAACGVIAIWTGG